MAVGRATLVVQTSFTDDHQTVESVLAAAIDKTRLRRVGSAKAYERSDGGLEVRCDVEYGPVLGVSEHDFRRWFPTVRNNCTFSITQMAVLRYTRIEQSTEDVAAHLAELERQVADAEVDLHVRERFSKDISRIRAQLCQAG
jgi:hypothetical protein